MAKLKQNCNDEHVGRDGKAACAGWNVLNITTRMNFITPKCQLFAIKRCLDLVGACPTAVDFDG